jgi:hypothetical protein
VAEGIAIVLAGAAMVAVGVVIALNVRGFGYRVATFQGAFMLPFDGGKSLRHRELIWRVWGGIIVLIGLGWLAGGIAHIA